MTPYLRAEGFSPDRSLLVTVTEDGKAFLVDGNSGDAHGEPRDLGAPGRWVDFQKDGKHFVTTAGTKAIVWSVDDATPSGPPIEHPGEGDRELRMARFSPDGNLIVTAGADGTARVWDSTSRKEVAALKKHEGAVTSARFSADGKLLVTTGEDGFVIVWDTAVVEGPWFNFGAKGIDLYRILLNGDRKSDSDEYDHSSGSVRRISCSRFCVDPHQ